MLCKNNSQNGGNVPVQVQNRTNMPPQPSHHTAMSTRIVLGVLAAFFLGVWSLTWYISSSLHHDLERAAHTQQFAALGLLSRSLQEDFDERQAALRQAAKDITPAMLTRPADLEQLLRQRPLLGTLFNGGVTVLSATGEVLAATPDALLPKGARLDHDNAVQAALQRGESSVGSPRLDDNARLPIFLFVVPLMQPNGETMGALAATNNLLGESFLNSVTDERYGQGGSFVLVDPATRTIVTASDKRRILQSLPAQGSIVEIDRFANGQEGTAHYTNPAGIEVLSSSKRLSNPAWDLGVTQPAAEAFAPLQRQQTRLYLAAACISLLGLLAGVPLLRRELRPIRQAAQTLQRMSAGHMPHQALAVPHQADVAELITGFNQVVQTLTERETLLRGLFDTSSVGILLVDTRMCITQANPCMAELFACTLEQLMGVEYASLLEPSQREIGRVRTQALLDAKFDTVDVDRMFLRMDGSTFWGRLTGRRLYGPDGTLRGLLGAITDITERKRLQQFDSFRSQTLEMLARDEPLDAILLHTVQGVEAINPQSRCSCILLTPDGRHLGRSFGPSLPAFYTEAITNLPIGPTAGSCGAAAYLGQRVVVDNIATHPNWAPYKELAAQAGLGACWSQPIFAADGRVLGTMAVYHATPNTPTDTDITIIEQSARLASIAIERSEGAQRLRDSEAHFRLLTEGVGDVVWRQDCNNVFTYISPADERMRGFSASEVVGQHVFELMTEEGIASIQAASARRAQADSQGIAENTLSFELEQKCKWGGTVWTEVRSTAERDANGNIIGYRGITRDITQRRATEARLQLAASVFTHAQEGIMITAPDGRILDVNAAFTKITGYSRDEVLGANPRILSSGRNGPDFYDAMFSQLRELGQWQGEIWNRRKDGSIYAQNDTVSAVRDDKGQLLHYVSLFFDITALKEQQEKLEHSAHFDALTDLPNRVLLMDRLHQCMVQAQRRGEPLALVFLDLDGFKAVNDQHGHAVGDALLQALALRMRAALRDGDTLARLGGDEFVAVLVDLPDTGASVPLLQRLLHAASEPVQLGERQVQVSASLGVTYYPQPREVDADMLLRQGDQAMYTAKVDGKNRFHVFAPPPATPA